MWLGIIFFVMLCIFILPSAYVSFLKPCDVIIENEAKTLREAKAVLKYYSTHYQCWVCEFHDGVSRFGHIFAGPEDYSKNQKVDVIKQELSSANDGRWTVVPV